MSETENTPKKTPTKKAPKKASARGLGRGLSALMADVSVPVQETPQSQTPQIKTAEKPAVTSAAVVTPVITDTPDTSARNVQFIAISRLVRNPDQPRKMFNEKDMAELTDSIRRQGVLQPILVRPIPESVRSKAESATADFQIVAGERRWQASLKAGLDAMPVLIRQLTDQEVLEIGVVENVQRADLNPIEEARAYRALMDDFGRTQVDVSEAIGKARSHIANLLRLLEMPNQVMRWVELGRITPGHAKAIMTMPDPTETADMVIREGLSVRATEQYVKRYKEGAPIISNLTVPREVDPNIKALEREISETLGLHVALNHKGPGGELKIKYRTNAQLEDVMRRLKA
jgi:ParB family chromosome partitioning protein